MEMKGRKKRDLHFGDFEAIIFFSVFFFFFLFCFYKSNKTKINFYLNNRKNEMKQTQINVNECVLKHKQ